MKKHDIGELKKLYGESDSCDQDVFAEQKSNILMMSGKHWAKVAQGLSRNLQAAGADRSKRLRLVKNHLNKAMSDRKDILASMLGDQLVVARNADETKDQKVAEIAQKILAYGKEENEWADFQARSLDSFEDMGEAVSKIFFHPHKGGVKAFHQKVEMIGDQKIPMYKDAQGKPTPEPKDELGNDHEQLPDMTKAQMKGKVVIERYSPFDCLRAKSAKSMSESPFVKVRKMIAKDELVKLIKDSKTMTDEEKTAKIESITEAGKTTYQVFDGNSGSFQEAPGQILLVESYFRSCAQYPQGYYYIWTFGGILFDGPIPFGEHGEVAFPIKFKANEQYETSARGFSPMKKARPAQLEVNRCASAISETQVTVGWDKIIMQGQGKFSRGADQAGLRVFHANGETQVIPGRSGDQFTGYLESNVNEIYSLLQVPDNNASAAQAFDPKAELFKRQKQKAKFTRGQEKLASYFGSVCSTYLFLAQKYLPDDELAQIIGANDMADVQEFKNASYMAFSIKMEEVSGDLDSMMGKMIELETILQYAGDLDDATKTALLRQFPHLNKEAAFKHLSLAQDSIESDIMALDRGEWRDVQPGDDHEMALKYLSNRKRQRDWRNLPSDIKALFEKRIAMHQEIQAEQLEKVRRAQAGIIPVGGPLVKIQFYVNDPKNPNKTVLATAPSESLQWLLETIEQQGMAQARLVEMGNLEQQSQIAERLGPMSASPQQNEQMPMIGNGGM